MKVAVIGANGQLGRDVVDAFRVHGDQVCELTHDEIELSSLESVTSCLERERPEFVVNTAAMHQVERCERHPDQAYAVNVRGALNLATATRDLGSVLLHVSTDYVFDGRKGSPYVETDEANPLNAYGNTKLEGERLVTANPRHFVVRTAALYGKSPCRAKGGQNFVELMLRLGRERGRVRVVNDEFTTPTSTQELARQIVVLSRSDKHGVFHATAEGSCSWHEFAREIFASAGMQVNVEVASPGEFPQKVPRPSYSVLENRALKNLKLNVFTPWQFGLRTYLEAKQQENADIVPALN